MEEVCKMPVAAFAQERKDMHIWDAREFIKVEFLAHQLARLERAAWALG